MKILTKKKDQILIDPRDAYLKNFKWHLSMKKYAAHTFYYGPKKFQRIFMHHCIVGFPIRGLGFEVDHINGNKLDNRRSNLRIVTCRENNHNRKFRNTKHSSFIGVTKSRGRWIARLKVNGQVLILVSANTESFAGEAYRIALDKIKQLGFK